MDSEREKKLNRVRAYLSEQPFTGILLGKRYNFAWLTAGADNHVEDGTRDGNSHLLVTEDRVYLLGSRIEMPRLRAEEDIGLGETEVEYDWYEGDLVEVVKGLSLDPKRIRTDTSGLGFSVLPGDFEELRYELTEEEIPRYRQLGKEVTEIVENFCFTIEKGETEYEISARLAAGIKKHGINPALVLVGSDERGMNYRHPIPKGKKARSYVMVVVCAERRGQYVNLTRSVSFDPVEKELSKKQRVCAEVEAEAVINTKVGKPLNEVLDRMKEVYSAHDYPEQPELHHQGGPTGYREREFLVTPETKQEVRNNQAFTWNPSVNGAKTEDTILADRTGVSPISEPGESWPVWEVEKEDKVIRRPRIAEI